MTKFITTTELTNETVIQKNCQPDLLEPFIDIAQEIYILRILGQAQYDELTNDINANTITGLTANNTLLLAKIVKPLCYATFYEALPFIYAKITNKGIVKKSSGQDSESVDIKEMEKLRMSIQNWMEFYLEEFKRWLRNNKNSFPLWREDIFQETDLSSGTTRPTKYFSGIQFDRLPDRFDGGFYKWSDFN